MPEENLTHYRALTRIADKFDSLGDALFNIGEYEEANAAWRKGSKILSRALLLRVPGKVEAQLLEGTYTPCTTKCGAPEPCFGCDSGDYVDA